MDETLLNRDQLDRILRCFFKGLSEKDKMLCKKDENERWNSRTRNLLDWSLHFLKHHFREPPSKMHRWLCKELDRTRIERGLKYNVLAPRGAAKSTIGTFAFPLREALENREPYIWIVSDTMSQAHAHLENLKSELVENEKILQRYSESSGKSSHWRNGSITLKNGVMIEAFGTGQSIRGRRHKQHRPSLIICDDLQNDDHIISSYARDKSRSWFHGTLLKAGQPRTTVLNLATALHHEAIAMELIDKPGWISKKFRAIEKWPVHTTLWEQWESIYTRIDDPESSQKADRFYSEHFQEMNEGCEILWPRREDIYTLMKMRVESGRTSFEREKQNSPVNPEYCEWEESYFGEFLWFEQKPCDPLCTVMSLDPSKGTDSHRGDYSAFVVVSLGKDGFYYVDADLERRSVAEIISQGVELYRRFQPDLFAIESNQFQNLLESDFVREFRDRGLPHVQPYPLENRINKIVRIRRLGPLLSSKRIRFRANSPSAKLLVEQLKTFPVGDHDDGPDAMEMSIRLIGELMKEPDMKIDKFSTNMQWGFS